MSRIWFPAYNDFSLSEIKSFIEVNMLKHLDIKITEMNDDEFVGTMPVDHRTMQPMGLLHGGASCVLGESLASIASYLCVDPDKYNVVGLEINANHLRSATKGLVKGICKPLNLGKKIHVWEIKIYDEEDKLICVSRMTNTVLNKR